MNGFSISTFKVKMCQIFLRVGEGTGSIQNFSFFATAFYSKSSVSETTGRKEIKVYIF